jgi:hypothetical protein
MTFSYSFDDENIKNNRHSHVRTMLLGIILARWRHPVAYVKLWTSFIGQCTQLRTGASPRPSKWPSSHVYLLIVVCLPVALATAWVIWSK